MTTQDVQLPAGQSSTPLSIPVFRKLGPTDRQQIEAHLLRLDSADRRMRFCGMVSDQSISLHCAQIDWTQSIALGCFIDEQLCGLAELKILAHIPASNAEIAITVERSIQNRGVGTELLRKLIAIARNRFIGEASLICLLENRKMQKIVNQLRANLTNFEGQAEGRIRLALPSYLSFAEEVAIDSQAFWRAICNRTKPVTKPAMSCS